MKSLDRFTEYMIFLFVGFLIGALVGYRQKVSTHPIEEIVKADSLVKVNDSIKIVVDSLNSIKDAKVIEVQTLDNDSTLKLFYELVKE